jgi:hypothetical protein
MAAAQVPLAATIIVPERGPETDELKNFSYLGACALMFCVIQQPPGDRSTIAICSAYTATYGDRPVLEGTLLRFPTPDYFLVARGHLLDATRATGRNPQIGDKRPRPAALVISGEPSGITTGERGFSKDCLTCDEKSTFKLSARLVWARDQVLEDSGRVVGSGRGGSLVGGAREGEGGKGSSRGG